MIYAICCSGIGVLLSGWSEPALRPIFITETALVLLGILFGLLTAPKRSIVIILGSVAGAGLLLILKNLMFGISSDAFILIPFLGEILFFSAGAALLTAFLRKAHG